LGDAAADADFLLLFFLMVLGIMAIGDVGRVNGGQWW
jgi:hypothetical protein